MNPARNHPVMPRLARGHLHLLRAPRPACRGGVGPRSRTHPGERLDGQRAHRRTGLVGHDSEPDPELRPVHPGAQSRVAAVPGLPARAGVCAGRRATAAAGADRGPRDHDRPPGRRRHPDRRLPAADAGGGVRAGGRGGSPTVGATSAGTPTARAVAAHVLHARVLRTGRRDRPVLSRPEPSAHRSPRLSERGGRPGHGVTADPGSARPSGHQHECGAGDRRHPGRGPARFLA